MSVLRVLLVDDHLAFIEAVAVLLELEADLHVVGCVTSAESAEAVARQATPDIALVDVELGEEDGIQLISRMRSEEPGLQAIVLTCHDDARTACAAVRAGALGFVAKDATAEQLVDAIRGVARGEGWIPSRLLGPVLEALREDTRTPSPEEARIAQLSGREQEVLASMVAGLNRVSIANRLGLSVNTVRTHTQHLLRKLGVHSSIEAVSLAHKARWQPPDAAPGGPRASPRR